MPSIAAQAAPVPAAPARQDRPGSLVDEEPSGDHSPDTSHVIDLTGDDDDINSAYPKQEQVTREQINKQKVHPPATSTLAKILASNLDEIWKEMALRTSAGRPVVSTQQTIRGRLRLQGFNVTGFLSPKLFPGFTGQVLPLRPDLPYEEIVSKLKRSVARTKTALEGVEKSRRDLRHDLIHATRAMTFVLHVAYRLSELGLHRDNAIAEAVLMAVDDGLFDREMLKWTANGWVLLDLGATFPGGQMEDTTVAIGNVEQLNNDRMLDLFASVNASIGQGHDEQTALAHSTLAWRMQQSNSPVAVAHLKTTANEDAKRSAHSSSTAVPLSSPPHDANWSSHPQSEDTIIAGIKCVAISDETCPVTFQPATSCLSLGKFMAESVYWSHPHVRSKGLAKSLGGLLTTAYEELKQHRQTLHQQSLEIWYQLKAGTQSLEIDWVSGPPLSPPPVASGSNTNVAGHSRFPSPLLHVHNACVPPDMSYASAPSGLTTAPSDPQPSERPGSTEPRSEIFGPGQHSSISTAKQAAWHDKTMSGLKRKAKDDGNRPAHNRTPSRPDSDAV